MEHTLYTSEGPCRHPLDKNENLFIPGEFLRALAVRALENLDLRTYPGGEDLELAQEISRRFPSVDPEDVIFTNGSDEAIDLMLLLVSRVRERPRALVLRPSFSVYWERAEVMGYRVEGLPLGRGGEEPDLSEAAERASRSDLVFLCSPNNPTGGLLSRELVKAVVESSKGLVVLDQAYAEFSEDPQDDLVGWRENLVVLRTFSKAYGLAGVRLGYILAGPGVARALRILVRPFHVSKASLRLGLEALRSWKEISGYLEELKRTRSWFLDRLRGVGRLRPLPSQTNFVLSRAESDPEEALRLLRRRGVCVRTYRDLFDGGDRHVRITVAPREILEGVLEVLEGGGGG